MFKEVTERAYAPLVAALYRHASIRATLHFSGPLLDWLEGNRPDVIGDLNDLQRRGQIELLSGGYFEPIITGVPRRDAVAQIRFLSDRLSGLFGRRPMGAWLAERVWEPQVPSILAEAGVAYTILDDAHFLYAGLRSEEITGSFLTEDQGFPLVIFPGSMRLRYLIPFRPVDATIKELRARADGGAKLVVYADDGEKFGSWPGTFQRVHKEGWLESFFAALEQADFIETTTLEDAWAFSKPVRRVYLPGGSYPEMMEWALDGPAARRASQARNALATKDELHWLVRGGEWRQFLARYPESNALHKRMLLVSEDLARRSILDASAEVRQAQQHLWRGQANDPYWHGVFGGIYLPHLRADAYSSLLKAERYLAGRRVATGEQRDYDVDAYDEYLFRGNHGAVIVHAVGGAVAEWDIYDAAVNLVDTLARRPEAEHEQLKRAEKAGKVRVGKASEKDERSIHEVVRAKERGLSRLLEYDPGRRLLFQDAIRTGREDFDLALHATPYTLTPQREGRTVSLVLEVPQREVGETKLAIRKDIRIADEGLSVGVRHRIRNVGEAEFTGTLRSTLNFGLLSEANAEDHVAVGARKFPLNKPFEAKAATEVVVHTATRHCDITLTLEKPARVTGRPIYSVANSEQGFERTYQCTELALDWELALEPDEHQDLQVSAAVVAQVVEPEVPRPGARRRRAAAAAEAKGETSRYPRR